MKLLFKIILSNLILISFISYSVFYSYPQNGYLKREIASQASTNEKLQYYLALDRFDYYLSLYRDFMKGKLSEEIIGALDTINEKTLLSKKYTYEKIANAQNFDQIIHEYITEQFPNIKISKEKLSWNYPFLKNKLMEGFRLQGQKDIEKNIDQLSDTPTVIEKIIDREFINQNDMTLDTGHYISNRLTRAAFWDAIENNREIEFHFGTPREFKNYLSAKSQEGVVLITEIVPMARNYNKVYLIKYPGDVQEKLVITNIGGEDRLNHILKHFNLANLSEKAFKNKIMMFNSPKMVLEGLEKKITSIFQSLPHPDRVIIGQKGQVLGIFDLLKKQNALLELYQKNPTFYSEIVTLTQSDKFITNDKKIIQDLYTKYQSKIEELNIQIPQFEKFDIDFTSAEVADIEFINSNQKKVRWRLISNMWGDEVVPFAKALKSNNIQDILYIGTAGAFEGKGYKVGDMIAPLMALDDQKKITLKTSPWEIDGIKKGGVVAHVASPFDESKDWFNKMKVKADLVEVETSYLADIFSGPADRLNVYLMISDVVGSSETLAKESSSKRKRGLEKLFTKLFEVDGVRKGIQATKVTHPEKVILKTVLNNKNEVFQYYLDAKFKGQFKNIEDLKKIIGGEQIFTNEYFLKRLETISTALQYISKNMNEQLVSPMIQVPRSFVLGNFNPKVDVLHLNIVPQNVSHLSKLKEIVQKAQNILDKNSKKSLAILNVAQDIDTHLVLVSGKELTKDFLTDVYFDTALKNFGLITTEGRTGGLNVVDIPDFKARPVCIDPHTFCSLSFSHVDDELFELAKSVRSMQTETIEEFKNRFNMQLLVHSRSDSKVTIEFVEENNFVNNQMASITPDFSNDGEGLVIKLKYHPDINKYPAIITEEIIHLDQILERPLHWAELTMNAEAGSIRAKIQLLEWELDAQNKLFKQNFAIDTDVFNKYIEKRKSNIVAMIEILKKDLTKQKKGLSPLEKQWKLVQDKLEKQNMKLDDYIAQNNRKKVAEIIESYLPWTEMEPSEKAVWSKWLNVIKENPANTKKVLTFRGLAGDLVRDSNDGSKFLMSTMLTKNQGNYNRRLRSFKTIKDKIRKQISSYNKNIYLGIAETFESHARNPVGSAYLSTSVLDIARGFSYDNVKRTNNIAAIYIDENRFLFNSINNFGEKELLIPLIVFPDEIVAMYNSEKDIKAIGNEVEMQAFFDKIKQKIGREINETDILRPELKAAEKATKTRDLLESVNPNALKRIPLPDSCAKALNILIH